MTSSNELRKAILKLKGHELAESDAFLQAVSFCVQRHDFTTSHDVLSLILVIFRHLRAAVQTNNPTTISFVEQTIQNYLAVALKPGHPMAEMILKSVECGDKISLLRSSDVLGAAARLAVDLKSTEKDKTRSDFLVPLFKHIALGPLSSKGELIIVNQTIASVPSDAIPEDQLLAKVVTQLKSADYASIRASIFIGHWVKHCSAGGVLESPVEQAMLESFIAYLTDEDDSTEAAVMSRNLSKYLLPAVFEAFPTSCAALLGKLRSCSTISSGSTTENGARFRSWIRVASLGSSTGAVKLEDLDRQQVLDSMGHADPEIRRQAFEVISGQHDTVKLLEQESIQYLKLVFQYNAVLPASSARTEWGSAVHLFFTRLQAATLVPRRISRRNTSSPLERATAAGQIAMLDGFFEWFFRHIIDPALLSARRPPSFRIIVALITLQNMLIVYGKEQERVDKLFTAERIKLLVGCQACEFAEVRARSKALDDLIGRLDAAPTPLPAYPSLAHPSTRTLLTSVWSGFDSPRKTQNDAAVAALCIVFERVVLVETSSGTGPGDLSSAVAFIATVADRVEKELDRIERNISGGLRDLNLHGPVAACRALISCIPLQTPQSQSAWKPILSRIITFVDRIWALTSQVMSLSANSDKTRGEGEAGPAHEISRAYEVMANGTADDDDEAADVHGEDEDGASAGGGAVDTTEDMDPRRLISGCWRATKEAGELLAMLIDRPLLQAGAQQTVWSRDEVDQAGRQYLQWMHVIRHRGTFSAIASAFTELVETVKKVKNFSDLPRAWLEAEITAITDDTLSTTRRSAALPYSLLSIVASDESLLDVAITELLSLASLDNERSSDITRIHAFNILKVVLLDARQSKFVGKYFERTVMVAIEGFRSTNWNVRNVSLLLFSTLVNRSLQSARTSQHMYISRSALAGRQTFAAWHEKYPRILPYIRDYLSKSQRDADQGEDCANHVTVAATGTALFPMLIILRSLRWSQEGEGAEGKGLQAELRVALGGLLDSREWQVRQVTAQALSSLYSPTSATSALTSIDLASAVNDNARHGLALLAYNLLTNTISPRLSDVDAKRIDATLVNMMRYCQHSETITGQRVQRPIETLIWSSILVFKDMSDVPSEAFSVASRLASASEISKAGKARALHFIGSDEHDRVLTRLVLASSTAIAPRLLSCHASDATISEVLFRLAAPNAPGMMKLVLDIALDEARGHTTRLEAMSWLCGSASSPIDGINEDVGRVSLSGSAGMEAGDDSLTRILRILDSRNTLLREKGMELLAWYTARMSSRDLGRDPKQNEDKVKAMAVLAMRISSACADDQSQPSREAASASLTHLAPFLFPSNDANSISTYRSSERHHLDTYMTPDDLFIFHRSILRILQDDDEDIRLAGAELVRLHVGARRPVCQAVALELWWTWAEGYVVGLKEGPRDQWVAWFKDLVREESGYHEDVQSVTLDATTSAKVELFEVEMPNLFRDPLADAVRAASLLDRLRGTAGDFITETTTADCKDAGFSPIDSGFAASRLLSLRNALRDRL